jgi:hypothetical protein
VGSPDQGMWVAPVPGQAGFGLAYPTSVAFQERGSPLRVSLPLTLSPVLLSQWIPDVSDSWWRVKRESKEVLGTEPVINSCYYHGVEN